MRCVFSQPDDAHQGRFIEDVLVHGNSHDIVQSLNFSLLSKLFFLFSSWLFIASLKSAKAWGDVTPPLGAKTEELGSWKCQNSIIQLRRKRHANFIYCFDGRLHFFGVFKITGSRILAGIRSMRYL